MFPMICIRQFARFNPIRRFPAIAHGKQHLSADSTASQPSAKKDPKSILVNYVTREGKKVAIEGQEGEDVMRVAQRNDIEIEGACEGSVACSTCHVYVDIKHYDDLPAASEEEDDMLDMAPFLKPTSRLGCQIKLTKDTDGMTVTLPPVTRNFYVDGHKPEPH